MRKDFIVLIVGESGSGKSEICRYLEDKYGLKEVKSYTTRPKRNENDKSHIFATDYDFDNVLDDIVAYTEYNGYKYCATAKQIEDCDTYIIDPDGIEYFFKKYTGKKIPMVVHISAPKEVRRERMLSRGHTIGAVETRLEIDTEEFANVRDYAIFTYTNADNGMEDVHDIGEDIYNTFFREGEEAWT